MRVISSFKRLRILEIDSLCRSTSGLMCPILTIGSSLNVSKTIQYENQESKKNEEKNMIVVTARVHPSEAVSSLMAEGVINFLLSDSKESSELRNKFTFKIIPMLNPDGVIQGNCRCALSGCDLNRKYVSASKV